MPSSSVESIRSNRDKDGWDSVWLEIDGPDALDYLLAETEKLRKENEVLLSCLEKSREHRRQLQLATKDELLSTLEDLRDALKVDE